MSVSLFHRALFFVLILLLASVAWGEEQTALSGGGEWSIGVGLDVASGTYGNETTTRFVAVPIILQYTPTPRWSLELDLPWVYQSNSVTTYGSVGASREQMSNPGGRVSLAAAGSHSGGPGGSGPMNLDPDKSQSGIGDATISAEYVLVEEGARQPRIGSLLYLKIPLANEEKGLGSGKFDEGVGLALAKTFGLTSYFVRGSYIFRGDSAEYDPENYLSYALGIGYLINFDLQAALALTGATKPFAGAPAPLEAQIRLNYRLSEQLRLGGSLGHGLSDGSPDIAAGIVILRSFN